MPCSPGMFIVGGADVLSHAQTAAPFDASQRMFVPDALHCSAPVALLPENLLVRLKERRHLQASYNQP